MRSGIRITRGWSDEHAIELRCIVSDGTSLFVNEVYSEPARLKEIVASLRSFAGQIDGGLLDVQLGAFGPEWGSGAFHARFHFARPGRLFVSTIQERDYTEFGTKLVASRATLHVKSEPALLDRFITALSALTVRSGGEAFLEGV